MRCSQSLGLGWAPTQPKDDKEGIYMDIGFAKDGGLGSAQSIHPLACNALLPRSRKW